MLRTRHKLCNVINDRSKYVFLRNASSNEAQWKEAKPFDQIPGPSTFGLIKGFMPGGKYQKLNMIELVQKLQQEFGDLTKLPGIFGQKNMIFTFDPNDIETIYRTEGKHPTRTGLDTLEYFRSVYRKEWFAKGTGLVPSQGQDWYDFRTKVNQTMLQPKTAKLYIPQVEEVVSELVAKIKKNRDANGEVPENFLDYLNEWALESIGLITLDTRLGVLDNPDSSEVNRILKDVARLSFEYDIQPGIWRMYKTKGFWNVMATYDKLSGIMKNYADEAMKRLESMKTSDDHEAGVLEKLMKIDKHVAFVMVLDSLLAGVDTTTAGLVATLYMLAKNPEKQEILRREVLKILPEKSSKLTPQSLNSVPYLRAVIKEALRLHPPINGNIRSTGTDLVLKGYQVPKDTVMVLATHVLSIQDQHFERSNEFIPERWLKENTDPKCPHATNSHPFAYLPFGFGPRMCVGRRFAELEIEVLTIRMIREFILEWHHPDLTFKSYTFNLPGAPLRFKVIDTES